MKITLGFAMFAAVSVAGLVSISNPAFAAAPASGPLATVHRFIDDFNHGDMAGARATHTASPSIIDEPAPHFWSGPSAFDSWVGDLMKGAKADGDTDQSVRLGAVAANYVEGEVAYVHIHADYRYREHGKAMVEHGGFSFALARAGGEWKIAGWAWNASKPQAVHAAPKAALAKPKA